MRFFEGSKSGSDERHSSVNVKFDAVDKAPRVRGKKKGPTRKFLRLPHATGRNKRRHLLLERRKQGIGNTQLFQDCCLHGPRAQNIDPDPPRFQLNRPVPRKGCDSRLGTGIDRVVGQHLGRGRELVTMMLPPSRINGNMACTPKNTPRVLMAKCRS